MRIYRRVLLVAALAIGMIALGVAWERWYISPMVEQAQRKAEPPEPAGDYLPAECLEELATLPPETSPGKPAVAAREAESSPTAAEANLRQGDIVNQSTMRIRGAESTSSAGVAPGSDGARPVQQAQSAEWISPAVQAADPRPGRRAQPETLPASAEIAIAANDTLKSVDVLDLMRRLRANDVDQRAEARRELVRRGFSEVDLELARQLFSPDAETRKQLARSVPRLSSVDAAQWLQWLALDPQPEVRLAAISTLATTGDPALLDRVETLARNDRDPQIQALAAQIAKQRDLASSRGDATEGPGRANRPR